jgi:2-C-methyl-D-erythritol 2,4-cyclodiphosphate synthase
MSTTRSGIGWDSHRLAEGRKLILGGVEIPHDRGLLGHSDADVLTHAVMDALLGAAGLGDIGQHFPDSDAQYKDADSLELLRRLVRRAAAEGVRPVHADMTVLMERPKLGHYRDAIRTSLAAGLGLEPAAVNVKASTGEGMGFVGREEGVAALAIVTVSVEAR